MAKNISLNRKSGQERKFKFKAVEVSEKQWDWQV